MAIFPSPEMQQATSLVGAAVVLIPFLGVNFFKMRANGVVYAFMNFVGTGLLALTVIEPLNMGLLIVEATWSVASLILFFKALQRSAS